MRLLCSSPLMFAFSGEFCFCEPGSRGQRCSSQQGRTRRLPNLQEAKWCLGSMGGTDSASPRGQHNDQTQRATFPQGHRNSQSWESIKVQVGAGGMRMTTGYSDSQKSPRTHTVIFSHISTSEAAFHQSQLQYVEGTCSVLQSQRPFSLMTADCDHRTQLLHRARSSEN